jgi:peptidoglycan/xylan/chitin deacetylase (PgdA/CDA1 family)
MRLLLAALILCWHATTALAADPTVYLTFDDGPLSGTSNILDVLEAEAVPAALFMVGEHANADAERKALLARAKASALLTVGNHSFTHAHNHYRKFYADADAVLKDMQEASTALGLSETPVHARLPGRNVFRMPKLSRDDYGIGKAEDGLERKDFDEVAAAGYYLYGWDHEWTHEDSGKPVQAVETLLSEIDGKFTAGTEIDNGNLILLMHDEMFQDKFDGANQLKALIAGLKSRGYTFGHIADYDD